MKKSIIALAISIMSFSSFATVDGMTRVYILTKDYNSEEFVVEKAPIIGCWGLPKGPELIQLTHPYVTNNLGCGSATKENINVLTCAKVIDSVESRDFSTFSEITLDISKCEDKSSADFIEAIKKVVKVNFATKTVKNPLLKIIK
jgi:hypothetical protein